MGSSLHRTHDTDGSLSIAFVSSPAEFESWISWAIIPSGSDRAGVQSLISFKQTDGSMTVKSYKLSHYQSVEQKNLTLGVPDMSAERFNCWKSSQHPLFTSVISVMYNLYYN
ncbi:hypothetical protein VitviT2T_005750 [Vitis vinifera]|uniref:AIR12 DOMON domain-containing protein n=1 Tax=Vitis vinifera TaxID=29760 RepID=A0ABY9BTV0_VITVI|nr:hypothetical protein VitviT2T_005750 [Vitis vinifera]